MYPSRIKATEQAEVAVSIDKISGSGSGILVFRLFFMGGFRKGVFVKIYTGKRGRLPTLIKLSRAAFYAQKLNRQTKCVCLSTIAFKPYNYLNPHTVLPVKV